MPTASDLTQLLHSLLMSGATRAQVEDHLAKQAKDAGTPAPSAAELASAYAAVVQQWMDGADEPAELSYAYHIALRKHLIAKTTMLNDYPTAARIAADLAKLQDQYRSARQAQERAPARAAAIERLRARNIKLRSVK